MNTKARRDNNLKLFLEDLENNPDSELAFFGFNSAKKEMLQNLH